MTDPEPTPVVLLPNGNIAYKMPAWWREIGPDGKDYGNLPVLPKGAVRMVPELPRDPGLPATDDDIRDLAQRIAEPLNALMGELANERARRVELWKRAEAAENALDDAARSWRERMADWWNERRGGDL